MYKTTLKGSAEGELSQDTEGSSPGGRPRTRGRVSAAANQTDVWQRGCVCPLFLWYSVTVYTRKGANVTQPMVRRAHTVDRLRAPHTFSYTFWSYCTFTEVSGCLNNCLLHCLMKSDGRNQSHWAGSKFHLNGFMYIGIVCKLDTQGITYSIKTVNQPGQLLLSGSIWIAKPVHDYSNAIILCYSEMKPRDEPGPAHGNNILHALLIPKGRSRNLKAWFISKHMAICGYIIRAKGIKRTQKAQLELHLNKTNLQNPWKVLLAKVVWRDYKQKISWYATFHPDGGLSGSLKAHTFRTEAESFPARGNILLRSSLL